MLVRTFTTVPALALIAGIMALVGPSAAVSAPADRDCGDFSSQKAAQIFFLAHDPGADPHGLDADGDGVACESNPCPCYTGSTAPGQPGQPNPTPSPGPGTLKQKARIDRVVDGDTVDVRLAGRTERVRLIGIDTPEIYGGVECGGPQASSHAKRLLRPGDRVTLISDPTQDRVDAYGRLLRYVVEARRDINRALVWRGWATVYVYDRVPFKRVKAYRTAQARAKRADRGIWGRC